ncbi:Fungal transcriptional regulatory protein N-terminal, partial [Colletotrichum asianum]
MEPSKRRRTGCTECRRKKSKCDEKKPVCTRCTKYPRLCSYELSIKTTEFKISKPSTRKHGFQRIPVDCTPAIMHPSKPQVAGIISLRSTQHRFYLHHFITHTATIYFPLQPDALLHFAIPVAESSPAMLAAILAASCNHFFRLRGFQDARNAATEATVQSLSRLREAIPTSRFRGESPALLATSLMLATTCLCVGDTTTYRQHLNGALHIVQRDGEQHQSDPLWSLGLKWLTHLILMNRISGLPLPTQQKTGALDWAPLLISLPGPGQIDPVTGLSLDIVTILDEICDLSDTPASPTEQSASPDRICEKDHDTDSVFAVDFPRERSLEVLLLYLKSQTPSPDSWTELDYSHYMFINAALISLYRRVDGLPKEDEK